MDYAEARRRMVDGQIKPNRVTDPRIMEAMRDVPRELFVPEVHRARALSDEDLALGGGRVLIQPMAIARLIQLAAARPGERALVLAAGPGYGAALLAHMGLQVTAVEDDAALAALGEAALAAAALPPGALRRHTGPSPQGWAEGAPYDLILVEGTIPEVPPALAEQLSEGGRLVALRRRAGEVGSAITGRRVGGTLSVVAGFDMQGTLLPAFVPRAGFALA